MELLYLIFDASDDGQGLGCWEAMASVPSGEQDAVVAEARRVLAAAERQAPGPRGPQEEGGVWDAELQAQPDGAWVVVTLTLTGPWDWGEALLGR